MRGGSFKKFLGIFAGLAALSAPSAAVTNAGSGKPVVVVNDANYTRPKEVRPVMQLKASANANPYKHIRRGERNQRQYRKFLRQNPHRRNSKKAR